MLTRSMPRICMIMSLPQKWVDLRARTRTSAKGYLLDNGLVSSRSAIHELDSHSLCHVDCPNPRARAHIQHATWLVRLWWRLDEGRMV